MRCHLQGGPMNGRFVDVPLDAHRGYQICVPEMPKINYWDPKDRVNPQDDSVVMVHRYQVWNIDRSRMLAEATYVD